MPRHTRSGAVLTDLILEVFRVNGLLLGEGDRLTKDLGLTSARWQVMGAIDAGPLTTPQIARRMGLARQSVRRIVRELADEGVVELTGNPDHQRSKRVRLTSVGRKKLGAITELQAGWVNGLARGLPEKGLFASLELLRTLRARLGAAESAGPD